MRRIAAALSFFTATAIAAPAQASVDDQFLCRSADHASLLVAIKAFATDKAVVQILDDDDGEAELRELALRPGGNWQDFRYEDDAGRVFAGGNGKAVLLMRSSAYFCEYGSEAREEDTATGAQVDLVLSGQGLEIRRTGGGPESESLMFGDGKADVVAALWMAFGAPGEQSANAECGAGPMTFQRFGPFTANFSSDAWVGWSLDDGRSSPSVTVRLAGGAGIGSPVSALDGKAKWFDESTLGHEFAAKGIHGLASGESKTAAIETLWAGTNCHFR